MSENPRTIAQIEADLEKARESLTATVNELAGRLTPGSLAEDAKVQAKVKMSETGDKVKGLVADAKSGDARALAIVGGTALAACALLAVRIIRH